MYSYTLYTLYNVQFTAIHYIHCTLYSYTLYTIYSVHCTAIHYIQCILYSIQYTLYTLYACVHNKYPGWSPVYTLDDIAVMSIDFLLESEEDAVIWRGPKK